MVTASRGYTAPVAKAPLIPLAVERRAPGTQDVQIEIACVRRVPA